MKLTDVDPDDRSSWPSEVSDLLDSLDAAVPAVEDVSDLQTPEWAEGELRRALSGQRVIAYHATRLLDHEVDGIRAGGLRPFGRELFDERISLAYDAGAIDRSDRDRLLAGHMYAVGEAHDRGKRNGQVCAVLGRGSFADAAGTRPLLSTWGGEGIYFSSGTASSQDLLRGLGRPAVIKVRAPVVADWRQQPCFPSLDRVFLGTIRRLVTGADLFHPAQIPAADILAIWQPSDPEYVALGSLPS